MQPIAAAKKQNSPLPKLVQYTLKGNEKKLVMATHEQAEALTGLQVGGISALALKNKNFKIYLDKSATLFDQIYVSGGKRGLDVKLAVKDLVKITGAKFVEAT